MPNGNGDNIASVVLPNWLRIAIILLKDVGVPTVLSFLLLGAFFGWIKTPMTEMLEEMRSRAGEHAEILKAQDKVERDLLDNTKLTVEGDHDIVRELRDLGRINHTFLYLTCRNTARTPEDRSSCDRMQVETDK